MSVIHSSWVLLGRRSALRCGTARNSTVRSMEYSRHGSAITANPIHSRRVALGESTVLFMSVVPAYRGFGFQLQPVKGHRSLAGHGASSAITFSVSSSSEALGAGGYCLDGQGARKWSAIGR